MVEEKEEEYWFDSVMSPDGKWEVTFQSRGNKREGYEDRLDVLARDGKIWTHLWKKGVDEKQTYRYWDLDSRVAWSDDSKKLAVLTGEKILIFSVGPKGFDLKTDIDLPVRDGVKDKPYEIFWNGRASQLYLLYAGYTESQIYSVLPKLQLVKIGSRESIYHAPQAAEFVYWKNKSKEIYYDYDIVVRIAGRDYVYGLSKSEGHFDYPGKILLSPDLKHACFEAGSSGSSWYTIVRLGTVSSKLFDGDAYSLGSAGCRKWINNESVLVGERLYSGSLQYFLLNVRTGAKTYLTSGD